jgi:hypothetical protein
LEGSVFSRTVTTQKAENEDPQDIQDIGEFALSEPIHQHFPSFG